MNEPKKTKASAPRTVTLTTSDVLDRDYLDAMVEEYRAKFPDDHEQILLQPTCHPRQPFFVHYEDGVLLLKCGAIVFRDGRRCGKAGPPIRVHGGGGEDVVREEEPKPEPDSRCVTTEDGGCVSPDCMHADATEPSP